MTDNSGIGGRMAKGAVWMVAVRILDRSVGIVSTIILARLLVPADFGIVALATTIIAVLEIWSEFGFDMALIRDQNAKRRHYDTAWTLTVIRGAAVAALIVIFASPIATMFGDERIQPVLLCLAVMSLLEGFQSIRVVDFRKNLNLHKEFTFFMSARIVQFAVTIILAFVWGDYWALVAGILANRLAKLALSYVMAPFRPHFTFGGFHDLFGFSKWIVLNSVLNFATTRLDTFVVGRVTGVSQLGIYNMAYEISNMATTELVWPISRAIFPGFAKLVDKPRELIRSYNFSLSVIVIIALPVTAGIATTAEYFVPVLLGDKWRAAIPMMQVLAAYGGLRVLIANTGSLYLAINRPYLVAVMGVANLAVLVPSIIILTVRYGAEGAAWAVVMSSVPMIVLMFVFNKIFVGIAVFETLRFIVRPILSAGIMVSVILTMQVYMPVSTDFLVLFGQLGLLVSCGAFVYVSSVLLMWKATGHSGAVEARIIGLIRNRAGRLFGQ